MVVLNIVDQLFEQVTTVVNLEQGCVLLLIRVDTGDLLLHYAILLLSVGILVVRVEKATSWWLHFLVKL